MWSAIFVISTSWRWDVFLKIWVTMSGKEKIKQNTQNRLEYDSLNDSKKTKPKQKKNYLKYLFLQLLQRT